MGSEGESSGRKGGGSPSSADDQKPSSSWARLVSADSSHSHMEIQADEMTINSSIMGLSSSSTHNIFKIYRNVDSGIVKLQNLSSHAILINGQILEEKEHMSIESGNEIVLGSERSGFPIYHVHFIQGEWHSECSEEVSSLVDNLKCCICLNIWHDVVTVTPCLHNFCNACFSRWYRRLKIKGSNFICPQCRSDVYSVGRNYSLQNIIEDMLKNNPSLKRSDEDIVQLNKDSIVQSNIMLGRALPTIPERTHAGNHVEQDITKNYIRERGKTVHEIVHEWIIKLDTGEIDQPNLSAAPMQPITSATHLCNACSQIVAAHILHWFRLSIPKSELPPYVARREDCWWGHDCRTQHHNLDHARKLNHVCEPTRRARS